MRSRLNGSPQIISEVLSALGGYVFAYFPFQLPVFSAWHDLKNSCIILDFDQSKSQLKM